MRPVGRLALGSLALAAGTVAALAQSAVISARSGLIHYVEGQVYVGDQLVENKFGNFPEVKENQQLRTEEGRAEVLLTPGVFLRLGENSSFRMITNRLIDTRLEFLSGSAIVEAEEILKDNSITVVCQDAEVHILKKGLYRLDSSPAVLRVFDGDAQVASGGQTLEVKEGHEIALDTLAVSRFDKTAADALNRWSARRAEYLSVANVSSADSLRSSMFTGSSSMFASGWYWNPFFGMYTFVPGLAGMWFSPYGYPFWSPYNVYMAYGPGYYYSYPYYTGFGYGGGFGGYGNVYNSVSYKSVPVPSHSGSGGGGSSGSIASSHTPSGGGSSSGVTTANPPSTSISAPISHGSASSPHH